MDRFSIILGKAVKKAAKIKGGGSALPGLFMEKINPNFIKNTLGKLPYGVVVVSGTNGKTTTTKIVVELLEAQGLKVFTNKTGSNFVRGVAAALLEEVDFAGNLSADIAVLELDEAHAVHFVKIIPPKYSLLLNVMRDQLDRFGEIDYTANLLRQIGEKTTATVVLNRDDPRLSDEEFFKAFQAKKRTFGVSPELIREFPSDDDLHNDSAEYNKRSVCDETANFERTLTTVFSDDVSLERISGRQAIIMFDGENFDINFQISGIYNILNAAAALALVRAIFDFEKLTLDNRMIIKTLENVKPAFGRGEVLKIDDKTVELILVKNPAGFRLGLKSFDAEETDVMIAINDNYADGRDMSWLWDVDFSSLHKNGVDAVSGIRAYDMALRLFYDEIPFSPDDVNTDLSISLHKFLESKNQNKRIFCTYTAMLKIRNELSKITDVEKIL